MCYNIPHDVFFVRGQYMTTVQLGTIYIGSIDGETESSRENFEELFYTKNSKYNEIMKPEKFMITGRKGTGKTILARYLKKKISSKKNQVCRIYNKDDFKLQKLIDIQNRGLPDEELSIFWRWLLLKQLADVLIDSKNIKSYIPFTSLFKLKKFIESKYNDDIYKVKGLSKSHTKKRNVGGKLKYKGEADAELSTALEDQLQTNTSLRNKEYFELLQHLQSLVKDSLSQSNDITIIYDDLDELEKKVEQDETHNRTLISMIETIKSLNQWLSGEGFKSKIVLVLRSDILNQLHKDSSNSNKFTENIVELNWITKNYQNPYHHPLMEMIINKIQSNSTFKNMSNEDIYKKLFPKKIGGKEVIDYLLNHSFGRPRDITRYLNIIIEKYGDKETFEPAFFKDCLYQYSQWFYHELENEISIHVRKNQLHDGLRLISDYKKKTFNYPMIESFYNNNFSEYPQINNLKETITDLYKLGVLGNSWEHNKNQYHTSWGYRENASDEPIFTKSFVVHYGFKKYFAL
jgi:hypothetical protein